MLQGEEIVKPEDEQDPPHMYVWQFGGRPEITVAGPDEVRNLSQNDLCLLADKPDLTIEVCEAIIAIGDEDVLASLACNYEAPQAALTILASREDRVAGLARENPNARPEDKELSPIGNFGWNGVARFGEDRHATPQQAVALHEAYNLSPHPGGPLLGDVWREILAHTRSPGLP